MLYNVYLGQSIGIQHKRYQQSWHVAKLGGNWNNSSNCGLCYWNLNNTSSNRNRNIGSHLEYILAHSEQTLIQWHHLPYLSRTIQNHLSEQLVKHNNIRSKVKCIVRDKYILFSHSSTISLTHVLNFSTLNRGLILQKFTIIIKIIDMSNSRICLSDIFI